MDVYTELGTLINRIQTLYSESTEEWHRRERPVVNLKKRLMRELVDDTEVNRLISNYSMFLNERGAELLAQLSSCCSCPVTARVKTQNSIEFKIQNYQTVRHGFGEVPINKCLNDLFGVRVILTSFLSYEQVSDFIRDAYAGKYRCIDSSKSGYIATHLYFKKDNFSFPWELQIWNACHQAGNLSSHKQYKQAYTQWEKAGQEGGTFDG